MAVGRFQNGLNKTLTVLVDLIIIELSTRRQSMAMVFPFAELLYADRLQLITLILS